MAPKHAKMQISTCLFQQIFTAYRLSNIHSGRGRPDLVLSLLENQWKLKEKHDQNFSMEGNPSLNNKWHQKKEINPKEHDYETLNQGSE